MVHSARRFVAVFLALFVVVRAFIPRSTQPLQTRWRIRHSMRILRATHTSLVAMMPATVEKEHVKVGRPSTLDRPETKRRHQTDDPLRERKGMGHESWEVRIFNDGLNTREHVARSLVQVTGMSEITAYQTMMRAHQNGVAVVGRWVYEVAEMYHDALQKNGIICDIVPVDEET